MAWLGLDSFALVDWRHFWLDVFFSADHKLVFFRLDHFLVVAFEDFPQRNILVVEHLRVGIIV